ncbi:uncharacterized protein PAC_03814 [Phialocephala subalpina]|uniref:Uncharacterized protein n=1 Tax=Phialocephala subalpina TaxID=576137 RepID=A0A1L7WMD8_9HELO|nr:uncharacterized protein PAC_03814 [Phialocephala subalpina]
MFHKIDMTSTSPGLSDAQIAAWLSDPENAPQGSAGKIGKSTTKDKNKKNSHSHSHGDRGNKSNHSDKKSESHEKSKKTENESKRKSRSEKTKKSERGSEGRAKRLAGLIGKDYESMKEAHKKKKLIA